MGRSHFLICGMQCYFFSQHIIIIIIIIIIICARFIATCVSLWMLCALVLTYC